MHSTSSQQNPPQWRLVTAIIISLLFVLFMIMFLQYSAIFAAPDTFEANLIQEPSSSPTDVKESTILVGLSATTGNMVNGAYLYEDALIALDSQITSAESLMSFEETAVSPKTTNASSQVNQIYKVHLEPGADMAATIRRLEANPNVLFAEPDYLAHLITTPNDPLYGGQWGLSKINAPAAWDVTTGSNSVVIAVIDSGLDTNHPDFAGKLWTNPGEIAGNGIDDDGSKCIDDIHGCNIVDHNADLSDNTGHGTEVAGVLGAVSNNGQGVAGLCWNCQLMVLKVTQSGGVANYSDIIEAIHYATLKGADVINLSLGGASDSVSLRLAVEQAAETAVVVGGAGNDNNNAPFYPAAYESVLAVAGTGISDAKVGSSNYGSWVDVTAPGETITTTFDGGSYGMTSGTSMAAPFVSGLAGLLRSAHPSWSANTARAQIMQTATAVDSANPGYEGLLGNGRIDAAQALTIAAHPTLSYVSYTVDGVVNGRPEPGTTFDLNITLANNWADAANVRATLSSADSYVTIVGSSSNYGAINSFDSAANQTPFRVTIANTAPYAHDLVFNLNVTADGGYVTAVPVTISTAVSEVYPPATITTQTWTNDRIYIINKETGIPAGATLTIEPGTIIRFDGAYSLQVNGQLIADGTTESPIWFTSNQPSPSIGDWAHIFFDDSSVDAIFDSQQNYISGSILRHCIIEYGGGGIILQKAAPFIAQNTIRHNGGDTYWFGIGGIEVSTSSPESVVIADNHIMGTVTVYKPDGNIYLLDNTIQGNLRAEAGGGSINGNHISAFSELELSTGVGVSGTAGLYGRGPITITNNVVQNWSRGLAVADVETVTGNLLANNDTHGLVIEAGSPTISQNTIINNGQTAVYVQGGSPILNQNNLISSANGKLLNNQSATALDATGNWWGSVNTTNIESAIYDGSDEFGLGTVNYNNFLLSPDTNAPAYVHNIDISPESPIGIETATFDLHFSRPMNQSSNPIVNFHNSRLDTWDLHEPYDMINEIAIDNNNWKWVGTEGYGVAYFNGTTWAYYNPYNSGLPGHYIGSLAIENDDSKWFGTSDSGLAHLNGTTWTVYNTVNSALSADNVIAISIESDGTKWIGTTNGLARFNSSGWTVFNTSNSPLPHNVITAISIDSDGTKWFGTLGGGLAKLSGTTWTIFNTANSDLPNNWVGAITGDGIKWIGTGAGAARLENGSWTVYDTSNSNLPDNSVNDIYINTTGAVWFGTSGGAALLKDEIWTIYNVDNSDLPSNYVTSIVADVANNSTWFGTTNQGGIGVLYGGEVYSVVENAKWVSPSHWQGTYDITSIISRGSYGITISSIDGTDGMEIIPDSRFGFTVDYAGEITDQTPPASPFVLAGGIANNSSGFEAFWFDNDADSSITSYRYSLGSAPGAKDIINWTTTSATSIHLNGLGLVEGQHYWLSVQARNAGGLWSESAYSGFVAGQPISRVFLPAVMKP